MACDAQSLINTAYASGYSKLSERDLLECIVASACVGGGGGTGGAGLVGHGSPQGVATANPGTMYLDLDTDNLWMKATGTGNTGWAELIGT